MKNMLRVMLVLALATAMGVALAGCGGAAIERDPALVGVWAGENITLEISGDGKVITTHSDGSVYRGTWSTEDGIVMFVSEDGVESPTIFYSVSNFGLTLTYPDAGYSIVYTKAEQ